MITLLIILGVLHLIGFGLHVNNSDNNPDKSEVIMGGILFGIIFFLYHTALWFGDWTLPSLPTFLKSKKEKVYPLDSYHGFYWGDNVSWVDFNGKVCKGIVVGCNNSDTEIIRVLEQGYDSYIGVGYTSLTNLTPQPEMKKELELLDKAQKLQKEATNIMREAKKLRSNIFTH